MTVDKNCRANSACSLLNLMTNSKLIKFEIGLLKSVHNISKVINMSVMHHWYSRHFLRPSWFIWWWRQSWPLYSFLIASYRKAPTTVVDDRGSRFWYFLPANQWKFCEFVIHRIKRCANYLNEDLIWGNSLCGIKRHLWWWPWWRAYMSVEKFFEQLLDDVLVSTGQYAHRKYDAGYLFS